MIMLLSTCFNTSTLNIIKHRELVQLILIPTDQYYDGCIQDVTLILPTITSISKITINNHHYFVNFNIVIDQAILKTWYGNFTVGTAAPQPIQFFNIELADYSQCFKNVKIDADKGQLHLTQEKWSNCDLNFMKSKVLEIVFDLQSQLVSIAQIAILKDDNLYDIILTLNQQDIISLQQLVSYSQKWFLRIYDHDSPSVLINIPLYNISSINANIDNIILFANQAYVRFSHYNLKDICSINYDTSLSIRLTEILQNHDYYNNNYLAFSINNLTSVLNEREQNHCRETFYILQTKCSELVFLEQYQDYVLQFNSVQLQDFTECVFPSLQYLTLTIFDTSTKLEINSIFVASRYKFYNISNVSFMLKQKEICVEITGIIYGKLNIFLENRLTGFKLTNGIIWNSDNMNQCFTGDFSKIIDAKQAKHIIGYLVLDQNDHFFVSQIQLSSIIQSKIIVSVISLGISAVCTIIIYFLSKNMKVK
ncbi:hypothetical protein SS50377_26739 [Spironucleus salmonicida]|uniref:Transmembrane protein n=1 Tax=Spironucleus salmonicida TaxID=348837 RepID=V6LXD8_9EUKA|nr:hypothetical protein SS50377_26739 [Spironucleus salmonicida]|eukprot:EST49210.1 Hypothetical protein SS50377_10427 [Spironucleus salmonicida]